MNECLRSNAQNIDALPDCVSMYAVVFTIYVQVAKCPILRWVKGLKIEQMEATLNIK